MDRRTATGRRDGGRVAATAAGLVAMVAAHQRRAMPTATATALEMGLLMTYWELMARYYDRNGGVRSGNTAQDELFPSLTMTST